MDSIDKIKALVQSENPKRAIPELLLIQKQANDKNKRYPRLACLGLLQMEHDFYNMRQYIEEWNLAQTFGKQLLKRMRKRVGENLEGFQNFKAIQILDELDRLNQIYWRKYSPKKIYPQYGLSEPKQPKKEQKKKEIDYQPVQNKQQSQLAAEPVSRNSFFSRISFGQKNDQKKRELPSQNIFRLKASKEASQNSQSQNSSYSKFSKKGSNHSQTSILKKKINPFQQDIRLPSEQIRRLDERIQKKVNGPATPQKNVQIAKQVKMRYGNSNIKQEDEGDSFDFSVKNKQRIPFVQKLAESYGKSNVGLQNQATKTNNNSFFQFSQQKDLNQKIKSNKKKYEREFVAFSPQSDEEFASNRRQPNNFFIKSPVQKPLYTEQELSLIEMEIEPNFILSNIIKYQGFGAMDMLSKELQNFM